MLTMDRELLGPDGLPDAALLGTLLRRQAQELSLIHISRYENGINELPLRHLVTLCGFYHISADDILGIDPTRE